MGEAFDGRAAVVKLAYVAGAFSARDTAGIRANIASAAALANDIRRLRLDCGAIVPHLIGSPYVSAGSCVEFHDEFGYDWWIKETLEQMRRCDCVVLVDNWEASGGARGEVAEAQRLGLPVFQSLAELAAWLRPSLGQEAVG